jgi:hypothetical protein
VLKATVLFALCVFGKGALHAAVEQSRLAEPELRIGQGGGVHEAVVLIAVIPVHIVGGVSDNVFSSTHNWRKYFAACNMQGITQRALFGATPQHTSTQQITRLCAQPWEFPIYKATHRTHAMLPLRDSAHGPGLQVPVHQSKPLHDFQ